MGSSTDFFDAVACRHLEVDSLPFNVDYLVVARTSRPTGVAAKCRTSTAVPTALSPASRNGLMALSAAFSMIRIITGVASTSGNMAQSTYKLSLIPDLHTPSPPSGKKIRMATFRIFSYLPRPPGMEATIAVQLCDVELWHFLSVVEDI
jgi:hypothetical protein